MSTPSSSRGRGGADGELGTHDSNPDDVADPDGVSDADKARAGDAMRASFARLSPQGSDEWNFMGAFTHMGDRFGPYRPGASDAADLSASQERSRRSGRLGRLRPGSARAAGAPGAPGGEQSEVEEAMTDVIEAFRFLHARVSTLEARLAGEDTPFDGAAWLVPARELGVWVEPVAAYVTARARQGDVVHADCGEGALVRALRDVGVTARGVEPRGGVALRALESGCDVTIGEVAELLAGAPAASLGGLVLSGVVDRLPLHALLPVLARSRRSLAHGAPLVVVAERSSAGGRAEQPVPHDLGTGETLHVETWELLLARSGFVDVAPLPDGPDEGRFGITATTPS